MNNRQLLYRLIAVCYVVAIANIALSVISTLEATSAAPVARSRRPERAAGIQRGNGFMMRDNETFEEFLERVEHNNGSINLLGRRSSDEAEGQQQQEQQQDPAPSRTTSGEKDNAKSTDYSILVNGQEPATSAIPALRRQKSFKLKEGETIEEYITRQQGEKEEHPYTILINGKPRPTPDTLKLPIQRKKAFRLREGESLDEYLARTDGTLVQHGDPTSDGRADDDTPKAAPLKRIKAFAMKEGETIEEYRERQKEMINRSKGSKKPSTGSHIPKLPTVPEHSEVAENSNDDTAAATAPRRSAAFRPVGPDEIEKRSDGPLKAVPVRLSEPRSRSSAVYNQARRNGASPKKAAAAAAAARPSQPPSPLGVPVPVSISPAPRRSEVGRQQDKLSPRSTIPSTQSQQPQTDGTNPASNTQSPPSSPSFWSQLKAKAKKFATATKSLFRETKTDAKKLISDAKTEIERIESSVKRMEDEWRRIRQESKELARETEERVGRLWGETKDGVKDIWRDGKRKVKTLAKGGSVSPSAAQDAPAAPREEVQQEVQQQQEQAPAEEQYQL
ncbi:hypothetical protein HK102_002555 [Quaeritorhiza haematococci]|nr:hypothetical protein HK102_002555 [Quaeritorhiza haematococci]